METKFKKEKIIYWLFCLIIPFFSFKVIEKYVPQKANIFEFPNRPLELLFLSVMVLLLLDFVFIKKQTKISLLAEIYLFIFVYNGLLLIFKYTSIPVQDFPFRYSKSILIPAFLIYQFIFFLTLMWINKLSKQKLKQLARVYVVIGQIHAYIASILYILSVIGINNLNIGVAVRGALLRMQGFAPEPSFYGPYILTVILLKGFLDGFEFDFPLIVMFITFVLSFSSTAYLSFLVVMGFAILKHPDFKIKLYILGILVAVVILIILTGKFNFIFERIYEHIIIILKLGDTSKNMHAPRAHQLVKQIKLIFNTDYILGNGIGADIYYAGNIKSDIKNIFLKAWFEGGIVYLGLISTFLIVWYRKVKNTVLRMCGLTILVYVSTNTGGITIYPYFIWGLTYGLNVRGETTNE